VRTVLLDLGWLICAIDATVPLLWFLVHPFARNWRKRQRPLPLLGLCWVALWILAGLASSPWRHTVLYRWSWSWLLALPFWAGTSFLYGAGLRSLSLLRLIGRTELDPRREENRLVTGGIHSRLRHPIYLGHLCLMLGWSGMTGSLACWSLTAFAVATGALMIPLEERELEERFGETYREYRRHVPMIVPRWK
jgi:protein-S-isoprenylcysteine O-methyltransferase Ste14